MKAMVVAPTMAFVIFGYLPMTFPKPMGFEPCLNSGLV
jgi:hypothetical protein